MDSVQKLMHGEDGQDLVEYSLILVLVTMAVILVLQETGSSATSIWAGGSTTLQGAALTAS